MNDVRARFEPLKNKVPPTGALARESLIHMHFLRCSQVEIFERDQSWAEEKKMGCFLGVARGSEQPLRFLEMHYKGAGNDSAPVVLVGKGVTFDRYIHISLITL